MPLAVPPPPPQLSPQGFLNSSFVDPYNCESDEALLGDLLRPQDAVVLIDMTTPLATRARYDLVHYKFHYRHEAMSYEEQYLYGLTGADAVPARFAGRDGEWTDVWVWAKRAYWAGVSPVFYNLVTLTLISPRERHHLLIVNSGSCPVDQPRVPRSQDVFAQVLDNVTGSEGDLHHMVGSMGGIATSTERLRPMEIKNFFNSAGDSDSDACPTYHSYAWYTDTNLAVVLILSCILAAFPGFYVLALVNRRWRAAVARRQERLEQRLQQLHLFGSVPLGNGDYLVYLPKVGEAWSGVKRAVSRSAGHAGGDLEYRYFVMDAYANFAGLHSLLNARDGEASLEDVHRALRGEQFLMHALEPPVENLVRRMYVGRSSFSMAHYLHASRIQWVFRHHLIQLWRCKPAAAHTIAERAAESKQLMMRRKLKEADKRSEKNLKRMQGGDHRWAGSLQLDQGRGHGKEGKLLPSGAFVRSGITSAFDVVQQFMESVACYNSVFLLENADDVPEHVNLLFDCIDEVATHISELYVDAASLGMPVNHAEAVRNALKHVAKVMRMLTSPEEKQKVMRFMMLEVANVVPLLTSLVSGSDRAKLSGGGVGAGQARVARDAPSRLHRAKTWVPVADGDAVGLTNTMIEMSVTAVMEDVWMTCEEAGLMDPVPASDGLVKMPPWAAALFKFALCDWRWTQMVATVPMLLVLLTVLPIALEFLAYAVMAQDNNHFDPHRNAFDFDYYWALAFSPLVLWLVVLVVEFWHVQVLPGHWSPFVAAVRAVFNFCFGALIFMSAWGLALLVLWVSVALIAFPVHAAPVATLLLACFALTFLKATRLQGISQMLTEPVQQQIFSVLDMGIAFRAPPKLPMGKMSSLPMVMRKRVRSQGRAMAYRLKCIDLPDEHVTVAEGEFCTLLRDLYMSTTKESKQHVVALLFESVERHATQRATTALVTSLQLLVAREQEFLDLMQSELEVVARERCEDSFAHYASVFEEGGWVRNVEEEVRQKLGETRFNSGQRLLSLVLLYLLTGVFLLLAMHVLAEGSVTASMLACTLLVVFAGIYNHHDAARDASRNTAIQRKLGHAVASVMDAEKASATALEARVIPGSSGPPCAIIPTSAPQRIPQWQAAVQFDEPISENWSAPEGGVSAMQTTLNMQFGEQQLSKLQDNARGQVGGGSQFGTEDDAASVAQSDLSRYERQRAYGAQDDSQRGRGTMDGPNTPLAGILEMRDVEESGRDTILARTSMDGYLASAREVAKFTGSEPNPFSLEETPEIEETLPIRRQLSSDEEQGARGVGARSTGLWSPKREAAMRATLSSSGSFSMGHNRRATASNFGGDRDEAGPSYARRMSKDSTASAVGNDRSFRYSSLAAARNPGKVSYNSSFRKAQKAKGGSTRVGSVGVKMRVAEGDLGDMMAELENLRTSMVDSQEFMIEMRVETEKYASETHRLVAEGAQIAASAARTAHSQGLELVEDKRKQQAQMMEDMEARMHVAMSERLSEMEARLQEALQKVGEAVSNAVDSIDQSVRSTGDNVGAGIVQTQMAIAAYATPLHSISSTVARRQMSMVQQVEMMQTQLLHRMQRQDLAFVRVAEAVAEVHKEVAPEDVHAQEESDEEEEVKDFATAVERLRGGKDRSLRRSLLTHVTNLVGRDQEEDAYLPAPVPEMLSESLVMEMGDIDIPELPTSIPMPAAPPGNAALQYAEGVPPNFSFQQSSAPVQMQVPPLDLGAVKAAIKEAMQEIAALRGDGAPPLTYAQLGLGGAVDLGLLGEAAGAGLVETALLPPAAASPDKDAPHPVENQESPSTSAEVDTITNELVADVAEDGGVASATGPTPLQSEDQARARDAAARATLAAIQAAVRHGMSELAQHILEGQRNLNEFIVQSDLKQTTAITEGNEAIKTLIENAEQTDVVSSRLRTRDARRSRRRYDDDFSTGMTSSLSGQSRDNSPTKVSWQDPENDETDGPREAQRLSSRAAVVKKKGLEWKSKAHKLATSLKDQGFTVSAHQRAMDQVQRRLHNLNKQLMSVLQVNGFDTTAGLVVDSVVSDMVGEVTGDEPAEGRVLDQALAQEFKWADDESPPSTIEAAIAPLVTAHYTSLQEALAPVIDAHLASCADCGRLNMLHQVEAAMVDSASHVARMMGKLPMDQKLERSNLFMRRLHAAVGHTHDLVVGAEQRLCDVGRETQALLEASKQAMQTHVKDLVMSENVPLKSALDALSSEVHQHQQHFKSTMEPLLESAVHLAVVPDQGKQLTDALASLATQVQDSRDALEAQLELSKSSSSAQSEETNSAIRSCRDAVDAMQRDLGQVSVDLAGDMERHAREGRQHLDLRTGDLKKDVGNVHELLQSVAQMLRAKIEDLSTLTDEYGHKLGSQLTKVDACTAPLRDLVHDTSGRVERMESQGVADAEYVQLIHQSTVSHTEDLRALNAMFGKLKKRVERGDPLRLSSQMDEIRNDVNMLMRTMGMKIHATPLLRFRDTMNQMRREGKVGAPDKGGVTSADVDSMLAKFGHGGVIDPEGVMAMLEEYTRTRKIRDAPDLLHFKDGDAQAALGRGKKGGKRGNRREGARSPSRNPKPAGEESFAGIAHQQPEASNVSLEDVTLSGSERSVSPLPRQPGSSPYLASAFPPGGTHAHYQPRSHPYSGNEQDGGSPSNAPVPAWTEDLRSPSLAEEDGTDERYRSALGELQAELHAENSAA